MKKILLILSILNILKVSFAQNIQGKQFRISGKIDGLKNELVRIKIGQTSDIPIAIDSVISKNGEFFLKGEVNQTDIAYIEFDKLRKLFSFFIENSDITVLGHIDSLELIRIKGSKPQAEYERFMNEMSVFAKLQDDCKHKYNKAVSEGNINEIKLYDSISTAVFNHQINFMTLFARSNNNSIISPYIVYTQMLYYIDVNTLDTIVSNYNKYLLETAIGKKLKERLDILRKTALGNKFVEIALPDTNGLLVKLSSLKDNYILVDFWASWCLPCRKENPNLVMAYNKFKNKGFEIFGVSLDQNRNSWIKAIRDDGLIWTQVSDLKGWGSSAGVEYGVISIPHSLLIDKNGVIIAKDLRGEALLNKLMELMP